MNLKKAIVTGAAAVVCVGSVLNVSAAEAGGVYRDALKGKENLIIDVEAYKAAYSDLEAAFGDNTEAYITHYLTAGVYEGRTKGVLFDPLAYAEAYGDIGAAFGDDVFAIASHYVTCGIAENRTAGTAEGYADIAEAQAQTGVQVRAAGGNAYSQSGLGIQGDAGIQGAAGSQAGGSLNWTYYRKVEHYANDGVTLVRVEYYDANNRLIKYSVVKDFDDSTGSYKEDIYHYDEENKAEVLEGTNVYKDGGLVSGT